MIQSAIKKVNVPAGSCGSAAWMANSRFLSISWVFARLCPVSRRGKFDREGPDHRESAPFSCRLVDATSGNKQQLEARSGNWQRSEAKAFRQERAPRL
jgi:hypothetical protein